MKTLWLVTSAIHTKHGKFSTSERLEQTIKTLKNIKEKVPNAEIVLLESSGDVSISPEESELLNPYLCGLLNFNQDLQVRNIYSSTDNWDVVKNMTEISVFCKALDFMLYQQPQMLKDIDRVFKLSGRYYLTSSFDISNFERQEHYIFASRKNSQFPPTVTNNLSYQFMSRLWSWPANKTQLVSFRYHLMLENFIGTINSGKYRDIEHLLFDQFGHNPYTLELPTIGVSGLLGPNGVNVQD